MMYGTMDRYQTVRRRREFSVFAEILYEQDDNDNGNSKLAIEIEKVNTDPKAKVHYTESNIPYYKILPEGAERCKMYTQFYRLVNGAKRWKKENIELRVGMYFIIYSPGANKYFLRQVHDALDPERFKQYIKDRNLYLINK